MPETTSLQELLASHHRSEHGYYVARSNTSLPKVTSAFSQTQHELLAKIEDHSFWFKHRHRIIRRAMTEAEPPPGVIADFGGGNGATTCFLQNLFREVLLVEPSETGVFNAMKRGVSYAVCSEIVNTGLSASSLAAVCAFDVLEHIADDKAALLEIYRVLKPGGRVYVTVPALMGLWSKYDEFSGHHRRYDRKGLQSLACKSGFHVETCRYFFSYIAPVQYIARTLPERFGVRRPLTYQKMVQSLSAPTPALNAALNVVSLIELLLFRFGAPPPLGASLVLVATKR